MASVKDILDGYRVITDGDKVQRTEVVDPTTGQIADGAKGVLGWDRYVGDVAPDDVVQQVKDVRAKIAAGGVALPATAANADARFVLDRCKKDRCYMYVERGPSRGKLVAELGANAAAIKASLALAAADPATKPATLTKLRIDYMKAMAFKHLMDAREGPTSAVNTYDKAIFTWGMGFAGPGLLPAVLSRIYGIEKARSSDMEKQYAQKLFYLAGFLCSDGKYWVLETETGKVFADPTNKPDEAYRVIHDTTELHQMWVLAAGDDLTREVVTRAQFEAFAKRTGDVPQAAKIQTAALYTFIAHLQHWTGDSFDVIAWATDPVADPKLENPLPSEKADAELAVQMVRRFYTKRSPDWDKNAFVQARTYWKEMVSADTKDEGLVDFVPSYDIMTSPPVDAVPEDHLAGAIARSKQAYDLGLLTDFRRKAPPAKPKDAPPDDTPPPSEPPPEAPPAPPPDKKDLEEPKWRCFPAGTPVATPAGPRAIEALREGDAVLAFDERTGMVTQAVIRRRVEHPPAACLRVSAGGSVVDVTPEHPFLTDAGWVSAGDLREGSRVRRRTPEGEPALVAVTGIEALPPDDRPLHDLSVDPCATYFAGDLLVHNKYF